MKFQCIIGLPNMAGLPGTCMNLRIEQADVSYLLHGSHNEYCFRSDHAKKHFDITCGSASAVASSQVLTFQFINLPICLPIIYANVPNHAPKPMFPVLPFLTSSLEPENQNTSHMTYNLHTYSLSPIRLPHPILSHGHPTSLVHQPLNGCAYQSGSPSLVV